MLRWVISTCMSLCLLHPVLRHPRMLCLLHPVLRHTPVLRCVVTCKSANLRLFVLVDTSICSPLDMIDPRSLTVTGPLCSKCVLLQSLSQDALS